MPEREGSYVSDHAHEPVMRGRWRTGTCARCGERTNAHLSWGEAIASKVGGNPLDYVQPLDKDRSEAPDA